MEKNNILLVTILPEDRLAIFPERKSESFQYIYREAAGIYWDNLKGCFGATERRTWSYGEWYKHMVGTISSGLGIKLLMTPQTEIISTKDEFESEIRRANLELHG